MNSYTVQVRVGSARRRDWRVFEVFYNAELAAIVARKLSETYECFTQEIRVRTLVQPGLDFEEGDK